jgi:DNA-binding NtrC family response regulator
MSHISSGVMKMEIGNREIEEREVPQEFAARHFPPLPKIPRSLELPRPLPRRRQELLGLFIDYLFGEKPINLKNAMEVIEKGVILRALGASGGNQRKAAQILGIKYTTLNQKVKRYRIRLQRGIRIFEA